jgi:hypothetical protein
VWKETLDQVKEWRLLLGPRAVVVSLNVGVESKVIAPPRSEIATATVVDGLESFRGHELSGALKDAGHSRGRNSRRSVVDVDVVITDTFHVRELSALGPDLEVFQSQMLRAGPLIEPSIPRFDTDIKVGRVPMLKATEVATCLSAGCSIPESKIHEATPRMRTFPHMRRAVKSHASGEDVGESYLREAEIANGIPSGEAEILAVFRNVPISMISRFRLLEESGVLLYTLSASPNASRAQVHEVAAIRDKVRKTTHLVAHRTRYRTAHIA